ncbi:MAG: hypothetical protein ACLRTQ_09645 [Candidatus Borkfalkia sp.]
MVDLERNARLQGELERVVGDRPRGRQLHNRGFMDKAPKNLVEAERAKLEKFIEMKAKIEAQLREL